MSDAELWTTDSICFRYFNLLQEFKTTKAIWIEWHSLIGKNNKIVSDSFLVTLEKKLGFVFANIK